MSPISGIFTKSSNDAFSKLSIVSKLIANIFAVLLPTCGIPSANINLSSEFSFDFSIASNKLETDLSPNPSSLIKSFSWFFNE